MMCYLCREGTKTGIPVFSVKGVKWNICATVEKHFWFQFPKNDPVICNECWSNVKGFDLFYTQIQVTHQMYIKIEPKETDVTHPQPDNSLKIHKTNIKTENEQLENELLENELLENELLENEANMDDRSSNFNDSNVNTEREYMDEDDTGQGSDNNLETTEELQLLQKWGVPELYDKFLKHNITKETMLIMTRRHCELLARGLKLEVLIKFEHSLMKWQAENHSAPGEINATDNKEPQEKSSAVPNIKNILTANLHGRSLLEIYRSTGKLTDRMRCRLLDILINHLLQNEVKMSLNLAAQLAEEIIKLFPSEAKDLYYLKDGNRVSGKIYSKYYNSIKTLRNSGLIKKNQNEEKDNKSPQNDTDFDQEIHDKIETIANDNLSWPELEQHWAATSVYRLDFIRKAAATEEILNKWPQYKKPLGHKLISIDFIAKFGKNEDRTAFFNNTCHKLMKLYETKLNISSRSYFEAMKRLTLSENGLHASVVHLLHGVLIPKSYSIKNEGNKRQHYRPSIVDSRNSFMLVGETVAELEKKVIDLKLNRDVQPLIFIIGTTMEPKEILVFFDNITYKTSTIFEAISICFQIFHVFDLKYPLPSQLVWTFVQQYLFQIKTKSDKQFSIVNSLCVELNNFNE